MSTMEEVIFKALFGDGGKVELSRAQLDGLDIRPSGNGNYSVLHENRVYRVEVERADYDSKQFAFRINGEQHEVILKNRTEMLVDELGFNNIGRKGADQVSAPMPGTVLSIDISEGDEVQAGQNILILEAMKMENVLCAPVDARVTQVLVQVGDAVQKGQLLVQFVND